MLPEREMDPPCSEPASDAVRECEDLAGLEDSQILEEEAEPVSEAVSIVC
jgi:hypothetical protein